MERKKGNGLINGVKEIKHSNVGNGFQKMN